MDGFNLRMLAEASGVPHDTLRSIRLRRTSGESKRKQIAAGLRVLGARYVAAADAMDPPERGDGEQDEGGGT